jgi:hypothetical protein
MHGARDWIFAVLFVAWSATPWMLVVLAWRKWARSRAPILEDLIDDPALLGGQILATVSCCALIPLWLTAIPRWESWPNIAIEYGMIASGVSAVVALFILPFGLRRAKWLSFASCSLNAGLVFTLLLASAE